MFDLHIHSIYSDGYMGPEAIVQYSKSIGLKGISITDHDTIDGIESTLQAGKKLNFEVIPGVEFGVTYQNSEVHILGYYIDHQSSDLVDSLKKIQTDRFKRIQHTIKKLNELAIPIKLEDLSQYGQKGVLSRSHIGQWLVENGYAVDIKEAFSIFLGIGAPCYVPKRTLTYERAIELIHQAGGLAVLAHPATIGNDQYVLDIISAGIDGIEIVNSKQSKEDIIRYVRLADEYHLLETGGSDCHGKPFRGKLLLGKYGVGYNNINHIKSKLGDKKYVFKKS